MSRKIAVTPILVDEYEAIASDNVYLKFHEDTESDVTFVRDYGNTTVFSNNTFALGGSGHTYSGGLFTPSGNQDNARINSDMLNFTRMDTLAGVGGIMVVVNVAVTARPASGSNTLIDTGIQSSPGTNMGWAISHNSSGEFKMGIRDDAGANTFGATVTVPNDASENAIGWYIDLTSGVPVVTGWLNGVETDTLNSITGTVLPPQSGKEFTLFGRTFGSIVDQTNTDSENIAVSDIRIIRFEYDAADLMSDAMKEYGNSPYVSRIRSLAGK